MFAKIKARLAAFVAAPVVRAQAARFARLFVVALTATGVLDKVLSGGATRTSVIAAVVGAAEVAFRKMRPA